MYNYLSLKGHKMKLMKFRTLAKVACLGVVMFGVRTAEASGSGPFLVKMVGTNWNTDQILVYIEGGIPNNGSSNPSSCTTLDAYVIQPGVSGHKERATLSMLAVSLEKTILVAPDSGCTGNRPIAKAIFLEK